MHIPTPLAYTTAFLTGFAAYAVAAVAGYGKEAGYAFDVAAVVTLLLLACLWLRKRLRRET